ncbi:methyltransferase regulatory domain-containing protein [Mergibacter septicus]|uniref:methyltransferase regulatory domain-containing protein n=1 Tax=Mergibacter septicus TaxID=221402 RepID=UPI0021C355E3|nr:methyltransferase regulatory domain-containing protein [Mergibacter septicus]UTU47909.1 methyltransferase regulatory domain-containing protein [Mergibacter septicus]
MQLPPPQLSIFQTKFDYIITHGVYSWVPDDVKNAILFLSAKLLKPTGLAYISYNTYPGWKQQDIIRDLMNYASRDTTNDSRKLSLAKKVLKTYAKSMLQSDDAYRQKSFHPLLNETIESVLNNNNDSYILHEYLEEYNDPCYFTDFVTQARKYGLEYLIDALMIPTYVTFTNDFGHLDRIEKEQYGDFLCNRNFRASILTHPSNIPTTNQSLNLHFAHTDLDKLEFFGSFIIKDDHITNAAGTSKHPKSYATLAQELTAHYPNTITLKYLIDKYPEKKKEFYQQIACLISYSVIGFLKHKLETFDYEKGNVRLKPRYIKYFDYFARNENPFICLSNLLNNNVKLNASQAKFALMFDGINSKQDIINAAKKFMLDTKQYFIITRQDGSKYTITDPVEMDKTCNIFITEIMDTLKNHYFFEKF